MKSILSTIFFVFFITAVHSQAPNLGTEYIEAWKKFYPSKAIAQGIQTAIFDYENLAPDNIQNWLDFNKKILTALTDTNSSYVQNNRIDARLLKVQIQGEIDKWEQKAIHQHSLTLYADLIAKAMDNILKTNYLTKKEKAALICQRLWSVHDFCTIARNAIKDGNKQDLEKGLKRLTKAALFYEQTLYDLTQAWTLPPKCAHPKKVAAHIRTLIDDIETDILPNAKDGKNILGRAEYARRLTLYTDSDLTPKRMEKMALDEIETVRKLIGIVSKEYLLKQYPDKNLPKKEEDIIKAAFADMEKDAPTSGEDYLQFWLELRKAAVDFIKEKDIATLPEFQTLRIIPAPESAGSAARIGWVDSAPPFAPNPLTTLYLPSISDTLPAQEQKDFWASFNKPFNRMIVIHELFPGHYMQIKISRETPHPVRLLFPYAVYFEGWATFTERVLLDAGWEKENPLTFLAHLRKRLENANRAYMSLHVHCNDWTQEQVMEFSTSKSLLAPQFAKSLWGRIMRSPMQLTSYFLGGRQFTDLLAAEKKRMGNAFTLKDFMDTIMRVGPIPIDQFSGIFKADN